MKIYLKKIFVILFLFLPGLVFLIPHYAGLLLSRFGIWGIGLILEGEEWVMAKENKAEFDKQFQEFVRNK